MIDPRPAGYVVGWLLALLGLTMALPAAIDIHDRHGNAAAFLISMLVTTAGGAAVALACGRRGRPELDLRQGIVIVTAAWLVYTAAATLPLMLGEPDLSYTDAFFETMSAMTTTGGTVLVGIEDLPRSVLLWRGLLQWIGGIGVILIAMILLPVLGVGGMQLLRTSDFNTLDKILPRAKEIAVAFGALYALLTLACALAFAGAGMSAFDAAVHAMTTISTGGMANYDASFANFSPAAQYFAAVFMLMGAMSFVRFLQAGRGELRPLLEDSQIRAFLVVYALLCAGLLLARGLQGDALGEQAFREVVFNAASVLTTTGFATTDYTTWGGLAGVLFFVAGMICGCSGSTTGGPKVFRYQLLLQAIAAEARILQRPNSVKVMRYRGRRVSEAVISSVMAYFMMFFLSLGIGAVALALLGVAPITAITGAATCLSNIGPGLGPEIGPAGNFAGLSDPAKWVLSALMLAGRLELLTVYVMVTANFWRA